MSNITYSYPQANYPNYYMSGLNVVSSMNDNSHLNKIYNDSMGFIIRTGSIDELLMLSTSSSTINAIIIDYL